MVMNKTLDIVKITWTDSCFLSGWNSADSIDKFWRDDEIIHTVGLLVKSSESFLMLASSVGWKMGDLIKIPRASVTQIVTIGKVETDCLRDEI